MRCRHAPVLGLLAALLACGGNPEQESRTRVLMDRHRRDYEGIVHLDEQRRQSLLDADLAEEERDFARTRMLRRKASELKDRMGSSYRKWRDKVAAAMKKEGIPESVLEVAFEGWIRERNLPDMRPEE